MKAAVFFSLFFFTNFIFSQINKCDCIVKLIEYNLEISEIVKNKETKKEYSKLSSKKGSKFSYNKIIKDSMSYWYISPIVNDSVLNKIIIVKKNANLLVINIQFNNKDSIPIYIEPSKNAKILKYIHLDNRKLTATDKMIGYELNDQWFSTCKLDWIKITSNQKNLKDKYSATGWISKENYLIK